MTPELKAKIIETLTEWKHECLTIAGGVFTKEEQASYEARAYDVQRLIDEVNQL